MRVQIEHNLVAWDELLDQWANCVDVAEAEEDLRSWVAEFAKSCLSMLFLVNLRKYIDPVSAVNDYTSADTINKAVEDLLEMARLRKHNPDYLKSEYLKNRKSR